VAMFFSGVATWSAPVTVGAVVTTRSGTSGVQESPSFAASAPGHVAKPSKPMGLMQTYRHR
jgi:hypothetical protein